jgi:hypothetical protein
MTALTRDLDEYLVDYNYDRAHTGRLTHDVCPPTSFTAHARLAPDDDADLSPQPRVRTG